MKELLKQAFEAGYDYRTSLLPEMGEYGPKPDFEHWYKQTKKKLKKGKTK